MYIWGRVPRQKKILWEKTKSYVEQRYTTPNVYMGVGYPAKKILWEKTKSYVEQRYTTPNVYMGGRVPGKKNPMGKNKIIRRTTLYDPKCIYGG